MGLFRRNLPNGSQELVAPVIGGKKRLVRMKSGTAQFLGLEPVKALVEGKKNSVKRGANNKAFKLLLKQKMKIGGANVKSLSHPVPSDVTLKMFYAYARNLRGVIGIVTPQGISYKWGEYQSGLDAFIPDAPPLPNPFGGGLDPGDVGDFVDFIGDIAGGGGFIGPGLEFIDDVVSD